MRIRRVFLALVVPALLAATCNGFAQEAEARPAPERLTADARRTTAGGATFTVPAGWSITTGKNMVVIEAPEPDTHIAIAESDASDAKAAVAAAWVAYKPAANRPLKLVTPRPARNGWEERQVFNYETSPNERAVVQVIASRAGQAWTVIILDGTEPTFEKRSAPIGLIVQSLRPKGYARASLSLRVKPIISMPHTSRCSRRSSRVP